MSRIIPFLLLAGFGALFIRSSRVPSRCAVEFPVLLTDADRGAEIVAQRATPGILNQPAPGWGVKKWLNLPDGARSLDVADLKGKVLYLYCFQSWCPGCHSHGFPTLQKMIKRYRGNDDVEFVAVQTVFEGFRSNTFEHAKGIAKRYHLDIPIGQSGENGKRSPLMRAYRTGGTPWTVIIDREGVVRFNDFHARELQASRLIDGLLEKSTAPKPMPKSRGGRDMIGKPLPLDGLRWLTSDGKPIATKGKVTLVRWWTDGCSYCRRSLPAIESLRKQSGQREFQTLGVYHAKPPRTVSDRAVRRDAEEMGYHGPLAIDRDWSVLKKIYLSSQRGSATSVSFLLDRDGIVRYVHPGPQFGTTDKPGQEQINRDFEDLKTAIELLLGE